MQDYREGFKIRFSCKSIFIKYGIPYSKPTHSENVRLGRVSHHKDQI